MRGAIQSSEPTMAVVTMLAHDTNQPSTPNQVAAMSIGCSGDQCQAQAVAAMGGIEVACTAAEGACRSAEHVGDAQPHGTQRPAHGGHRTGQRARADGPAGRREALAGLGFAGGRLDVIQTI